MDHKGPLSFQQIAKNNHKRPLVATRACELQYVSAA